MSSAPTAVVVRRYTLHSRLGLASLETIPSSRRAHCKRLKAFRLDVGYVQFGCTHVLEPHYHAERFCSLASRNDSPLAHRKDLESFCGIDKRFMTFTICRIQTLIAGAAQIFENRHEQYRRAQASLENITGDLTFRLQYSVVLCRGLVTITPSDSTC